MRFVIQDPQGERTVDLDADPVRIGRSQGCHIVVHDEKASREHCEVRRKDGRPLLVDLKSRNGTSVNGAAVTERLLDEGDRIEIGKTSIRIEALAAAPTAPAPPPGPPSGAPPKERCHLAFQEGERKGQVFVLDALTVSIGRAKSNALSFNDEKLSARHAEVFLDVATRRFRIRDAGSTNGTRVNGERITDAVLSSGAVIELGAQKMLFVDPAAVPTAPSVPSSSRARPAAETRGWRLAARVALIAAFLVLAAGGAMFLWKKIKAEPQPVAVTDLSAPRGSLIAHNHSFEEAGAAGTVPGWKVVANADGHVTRDGTQHAHGAHSLHLHASDPGSADGVMAVEYDEAIAVERGYAYAAKAWVKAVGCRGLAGLRATWRANGRDVGESFSPLVTGTEEWRVVTAVFVPPRRAREMRLACVAMGRFGDAWFDEVQLVKRAVEEADRPLLDRFAEWDLEVDARGGFALVHGGTEAAWGGELALWGTRRRGGQAQLLVEKAASRGEEGILARGRVIDLESGKEVPLSLTAAVASGRATLSYVAELPPGVLAARIALCARVAGGIRSLRLDGGRLDPREGEAEGVTRLDWTGAGAPLGWTFKAPVRVVATEEGGAVEVACIAAEKSATLTVTMDGEAPATSAPGEVPAREVLAKAREADAAGRPGEAILLYHEVAAKWPESEAALAFARPRLVRLEAQAEAKLAAYLAARPTKGEALLAEIARLYAGTEWEARAKEAQAAEGEAGKLAAMAEKAIAEEKWVLAEAYARNLVQKYPGTGHEAKGKELLARIETAQVEGLLKRARELVAARHPEQARALYEEILAKHPRHPLAEQARQELAALK